MKIPKKPAPLRKLEYTKRPKSAWNPKERHDIYNTLPVDRWPHKEGAAVIYIRRRERDICAGRVVWFHPAREMDASCVLSTGNKFFVIQHGNQTDRPSDKDVFEYSSKGFRLAILKLAKMFEGDREECLERAKTYRDLAETYDLHAKKLRSKV